MTKTLRTTEQAGWTDKPKDHPDVVRLRAHLSANNGIKGLEILAPAKSSSP
ncbi:MAG: hypothetical protein HC809_02800 [Gammaproteobacteria bacterium]|nr:hypothetical protein [Gammaproteobacteria bacterium]